MSQPSRTVPKFSSFKPKVPLDNSTAEARQLLESGSYRTGHVGTDAKTRRHNDTKHSEYKHSSRYDDRSSRKSYRGSESEAASFTSQKTHENGKVHARSNTRQPNSELEVSDLFYTDVRGDAKVVQYGSLDRYDIPAHHAIGYGRIIGAPIDVKIDYQLSDHASVVLRDTSRTLSERPLKSHRARSLAKLKLRRVQRQDSEVELQTDYIAFASSLSRKRSLDVIEDVDYRSINGKANPDLRLEDDDFEYVSESDTTPLSDVLGLQIRQHGAELLHRCKERPQNVELWLALVEHQEKLVHPGVEQLSFTDLEKRTLAEMRIAIYERAIKHSEKRSPDYARLVAGWLKDGNLVWEPGKLMVKWKEVLQQHSDNASLWIQYLDVVQSSHSSAHYQQCKTAFAQCIEAIHQAIRRTTSAQVTMIKESLLHVFLRFTSFTRDAGYTELAFAMWQIVLENAFSSPKVDFDASKIASLEGFWESDVPRIGEKDAQGWTHFDDNSKAGTRPVSDRIEQHWDRSRPFRSFCKGENASEGTAYLPASSDGDEEGIDDPFRAVFFSDLRDILPMVLDDFPPQSLFTAFLEFMHFPRQHSLGGRAASQSWQVDPYLSSVLDEGRHSKVASNAAEPILEMATASVETGKPKGNKTSDRAQFVTQVLDQFLAFNFDHDLAEYSLGLKVKYSPSEVRTYAKRLLKARPHDLRLYNAYALIELELGKLEKACSVWKAALSTCDALPSETRICEILLWHSWVRTELTGGNDANALYRLLSVAKASPMQESVPAFSTLVAATTDRLRAAQHFQEGWVHMLDSGNPQLAALHAICMTWLIYLTSCCELHLALDRLETSASTLLARSALSAAEVLHEAKAHLLRLHVERKRAYKPTFICETLAGSLSQFPDNDCLLSLYVKNEETIGITDRMRATLQNSTLSPNSASLKQWQYAVNAEIKRCTNFSPGSTPNSVRATFSRALLNSDSLVKHSPMLWEMWFEFEISRVERDGDSAVRALKKVFLDGLRCLPWYKRWVIVGLGVMEETGAMTRRELMQVYDVLGERGLRVRYGARLEELLEQTS